MVYMHITIGTKSKKCTRAHFTKKLKKKTKPTIPQSHEMLSLYKSNAYPRAESKLKCSSRKTTVRHKKNNTTLSRLSWVLFRFQAVSQKFSVLLSQYGYQISPLHKKYPILNNIQRREICLCRSKIFFGSKTKTMAIGLMRLNRNFVKIFWWNVHGFVCLRVFNYKIPMILLVS